jgi:hypothetical protein
MNYLEIEELFATIQDAKSDEIIVSVEQWQAIGAQLSNWSVREDSKGWYLLFCSKLVRPKKIRCPFPRMPGETDLR